MSTHVLGLDIGTSGLKGILVDEAGHVAARAAAEYPTAHPSAGRAEQDLLDWQNALRQVVSEISDAGVPIEAVAIVGHTPSLIVMDDRRAPQGPAITWQDVRADAEADELQRTFGDERPLVGGRLPWNPAYLPAKLLWYSRSGAAAGWLMQPKDALAFCLSGVPGTDTWGSKGLCRMDTGDPVLPLFELCEIPITLLPPRRSPWSVQGFVDAVGSEWSGLPTGTPVAVGWTDALGGMTGIGAFSEPTAFVLTGTSNIAGTTLGGGPFEDLLYVPASCAPLAVDYGPTQSSGASLMWWARVTGASVGELLTESRSAVGQAVPQFMPYLSGERAPIWLPQVRGEFTGLSAECGRAELTRAVLRGVAGADLHVLETAGHRGEPVHVGGSSAQAAAWQLARAEVWGVEVVLHREPDTSALGAAMLAMAAVSGTQLAEVSSAMLGDVEIVSPADADRLSADQLRMDYRAAVDRIRQLAAVSTAGAAP